MFIFFAKTIHESKKKKNLLHDAIQHLQFKVFIRMILGFPRAKQGLCHTKHGGAGGIIL